MKTKSRLWKTISHYWSQCRKSKHLHQSTLSTIESNSHQYKITPHYQNVIDTSIGSCERLMMRGIIWCYKTLYIKIAIFLVVFYFMSILLFAIILYYVNKFYHTISGKQCISYWQYPDSEIPGKFDASNFEYAFDLSWSTFSTVVSNLRKDELLSNLIFFAHAGVREVKNFKSHVHV